MIVIELCIIIVIETITITITITIQLTPQDRELLFRFLFHYF